MPLKLNTLFPRFPIALLLLAACGAHADVRVLDAPVGVLVAVNTIDPVKTAPVKASPAKSAPAKAAPVKPASVSSAAPVARVTQVAAAKASPAAKAAPKKSVARKQASRTSTKRKSASKSVVRPYREYWSAPRELSVMAGTQQEYVHNRPIKQVAVGDEKVATLTVVSGRTLLINALQPGVTTLHVWSDLKSSRPDVDARLVVSPNAELEKRALSRGGVSVDAPINKLRLSGTLESLAQHDELLQAVTAETKQIDKTVSGFESQVQIDIKIVELSRSKLMRSNIFLQYPVKKSDRIAFGTTTSSDISISSDVFQLGMVIGNLSKGLIAQFDILETNGFAYTLAEPSLTALSGQTATFLAGGEIPIPVSVTNSGGQQNIAIQFKEFGVRLALSPTVLDNQRIFLKVAPEVSELDPDNGVILSGTQIPGFRVRRTDTSVALGDGESFVISGLVSRGTIANADKFPGLGNIPYLGAFFRSNKFDRNDRELIMIVTPHIVKPLDQAAAKPPLPGERYRNYNPDYSDFVFKESGKFELPAGGFSK